MVNNGKVQHLVPYHGWSALRKHTDRATLHQPVMIKGKHTVEEVLDVKSTRYVMYSCIIGDEEPCQAE